MRPSFYVGNAGVAGIFDVSMSCVAPPTAPPRSFLI